MVVSSTCLTSAAGQSLYLLRTHHVHYRANSNNPNTSEIYTPFVTISSSCVPSSATTERTFNFYATTSTIAH